MIVDDMREADLADLAAIDPGAARLKEELLRPWARARVARDEAGRAVGYLVVWLVTDEVHVLDVAVHAARRRRGIGGALVDDMTAHARARGARHVFLEVRESNAAATRLYERAGFVAYNVRKAYYPDGEDAVEMRLSLG